MTKVQGYKAFNLDGTNVHGKVFKEGETYVTDRHIQFYQTGYHMCEHLTHVFSYYHPVESALVASVAGEGHIHYIPYDDYRDIYDLYAVEKITINHFFTRAEIFKQVLQEIPHDQKLFLSNATLTPEEKQIFISLFHDNFDLMRCLLYYQTNYTDVYQKSPEEVQRLVRKCYHG